MSEMTCAEAARTWPCANCKNPGVDVLHSFDFAMVTEGQIWCDLCILANITPQARGYESVPLEFLVEAA